MKEPVSYDAATDSMYVKIAPGASVRQRMDESREVIIDLGADGQPVGYDPDVIAEALALLQRKSSEAA